MSQMMKVFDWFISCMICYCCCLHPIRWLSRGCLIGYLVPQVILTRWQTQWTSRLLVRPGSWVYMSCTELPRWSTSTVTFDINQLNQSFISTHSGKDKTKYFGLLKYTYSYLLTDTLTWKNIQYLHTYSLQYPPTILPKELNACKCKNVRYKYIIKLRES